MITVENVSKQYGSNSVLRGISVQLHEGAIYGLVGANGCGKTTLMRCICGFSQPTSGYIVVNGCLIGGRSALRRNPELAKADAGIISRVSDFALNTGVIIETPGFLPHDPLGELLKKAAVLHGQHVRFAVLPAGQEKVVLRHFPAGNILGNDGVTGAVFNRKGGCILVQSGNAESRAGSFLFVGNQRAGLEPCPQGGNGGLYGLAHLFPPRNCLAASWANFSSSSLWSAMARWPQ